MGIKERILEFIKYKDLPIKQFEEMCGLSNGYISSMRKGFGASKLDNVLNQFPELNREWLLYGEGEMLQQNTGNNIDGDNNAQNTEYSVSGNHNVTGNGNEVHPNTSIVNKLLNELAEQRKLTETAQGQINRLITLLEKSQN